jgi:hypothetical protein
MVTDEGGREERDREIGVGRASRVTEKALGLRGPGLGRLRRSLPAPGSRTRAGVGRLALGAGHGGERLAGLILADEGPKVVAATGAGLSGRKEKHQHAQGGCLSRETEVKG